MRRKSLRLDSMLVTLFVNTLGFGRGSKPGYALLSKSLRETPAFGPGYSLRSSLKAGCQPESDLNV